MVEQSESSCVFIFSRLTLLEKVYKFNEQFIFTEIFAQ